MGCFIATAAEAVIVNVIKKKVEKQEAAGIVPAHAAPAIPWSRKLGWLNKMLWGGVFLLAIEHMWHGEVVLWPPFLTAMSNPADIQPMLMEILVVGGSMVLFVTAVWFLIALAAERIARRAQLPAE